MAALVESLKTQACEDLFAVLDAWQSPKTVVVESRLASLISAICPYSALTGRGVTRLLLLQEETQLTNETTVYLVGTDPIVVSRAAKHARSVFSHVAEADKIDLALIVVPKVTLAVRHILEQNGLTGVLEVAEWVADFAPAGPTLSMYIPGGGMHEPVAGQLVWSVASALDRLQARFGAIGHITGFGERALKVHELLQVKSNCRRATAADNGGFNYVFGDVFFGTNINHLVLIDREVDLVTPLLSQLTYGGLLDEVFGIAAGDVVHSPTKTVQLRDELFYELRDLNFAEVGQRLNQSARQLQSEYERRRDASSVEEIRQFVGKLGELQTLQTQLKLHTSLAEDILNRCQRARFRNALTLQQNLLANELNTSQAFAQLRHVMYSGGDVGLVLRLLCLLCICRGGVKDKTLNLFLAELCRTYGFSTLRKIHNLKDRGLLSSRPPGTTWIALTRSHELLNGQEEASSLYAGYTPLSVRLVENTIKNNKEKVFGVQVFDEVAESANAREAKLRRILLRNTPGHERPVLFVLYIGGVTYAEAAALRSAIQNAGRPVDLVVASTGIITGNDIVGVSRQVVA